MELEPEPEPETETELELELELEPESDPERWPRRPVEAKAGPSEEDACFRTLVGQLDAVDILEGGMQGGMEGGELGLALDELQLLAQVPSAPQVGDVGSGKATAAEPPAGRDAAVGPAARVEDGAAVEASQAYARDVAARPASLPSKKRVNANRGGKSKKYHGRRET